MTFLKWGSSAILVIYLSLEIVRIIRPLAFFKEARGRLMEIPGKIVGHKYEWKRSSGVLIAYPVYACRVDGKEKRQIGYTRLAIENRKKGSAVAIFYDPESGAIWNKRDIPFMEIEAKKQIVSIMFLIVAAIVGCFLP